MHTGGSAGEAGSLTGCCSGIGAASLSSSAGSLSITIGGIYAGSSGGIGAAGYRTDRLHLPDGAQDGAHARLVTAGRGH